MTAYLLGPPVLALLALALRLGWQTHSDRRRQHILTALATNLPPTAKVLEIHDIRDDGSQLRIRVVA